MKTKFDIQFFDIPMTDRRMEEWKIYLRIWKDNEWAAPAYYVGRWLGENGIPTLENMEERKFKQLQEALDVYLFHSNRHVA